jgi:hypothetical protein
MKRKPNIAITMSMAAFLVVALSFILPKNSEKYLGDRFWTQKTFASHHYDVVLMGDSRVYRGISPAIMEDQLPGMKVLNFGFSDGGLNNAMFEAAKEKLSDRSIHRILVLGVSANTLTGYTQSNKQFIQELSRPREELFERLYLNPVLYWFSSVTPEKLKEELRPHKVSSFYHSKYNRNGYVESEKFPVDTMEAMASYTKDFTRFKVETQYLDDLYRQVKIAVGEGIDVVAFRPPVTQPMFALEDSLGKYNEAEIKSGIEQAGGCWLDINSANYKTYDGSHLDKASAILLSLALSDFINSYITH